VSFTGTLILGGMVGAAVSKAYSDKEGNECIIPSDAKEPEKKNSDKWCIKRSFAASRTQNPLHAFLDSADINTLGPNGKTLIKLSIGDPTTYPAMLVCKQAREALEKAVAHMVENGDIATVGQLAVRQAVAWKYSGPSPVTENDVFITSGCASALSLAIASLVSEGQNVLLPTPGCPTYRTICSRYNLVPRFYVLNPKCGWDVNLRYLEKQIDNDTRAMVVNNPHNPSGSVLSRGNMMELLKVCAKYKIPLIADESYGNLNMSEEEITTFRSLHNLDTPVPIITVGGILEQYLVPGWRLGWIIVSDCGFVMDECKQGIRNMSQVTLGPNSVCQSAVPPLLDETPDSFFKEIKSTLKEHAAFMFDGLTKISTLNPIQPKGGIYMLVEVELTKLRGISSTWEFCRRLLLKERVFCLPGDLFQAPGYIRIILCPRLDILKEALARIKGFVVSLHLEE